MMSAETQAALDAWKAAQPPFVGKVTRETMPCKQSRRTAKAQLVKKASGS